MLSALGDVPAEIAVCFATGNTARMRALDCGLIEVGRSADFVLMDKAQHSAGRDLLESIQFGDLPGIGMTVIDGLIRSGRSRNTPPATRVPEVEAGATPTRARRPVRHWQKKQLRAASSTNPA
eukprot:gene27224-30044_t